MRVITNTRRQPPPRIKKQPINASSVQQSTLNTADNIMTLIQQLLISPPTPTVDATSSHPLPYFIFNKSSCRSPTMPIHWRNASEQNSRPQEISLNTRFNQPSQHLWNSKQPDLFCLPRPRLIPQDEYNLGSVHDRAITHSGILSTSTDPLAGWKKSYKDFPNYATDCMFSTIAQLRNVLKSNDRRASSELVRWHPFLLDLYEDYINLKLHNTQPAIPLNAKPLNKASNRPPAPTTPKNPSLLPSNGLTLSMIEDKPRREHDVIKDLITHLSETFLKSHSTTYYEYIALQSIDLRNKFLLDHPAFKAKRSLANTFFNACEHADGNPYSMFFARQKLCSDLEDLYSNMTTKAHAHTLQAHMLHTLTINTSSTDTDLPSPKSTTSNSPHYKVGIDICPSNLLCISPLENTCLVRYIHNPETTSQPPTVSEFP